MDDLKVNWKSWRNHIQNTKYWAPGIKKCKLLKTISSVTFYENMLFKKRAKKKKEKGQIFPVLSFTTDITQL